MSTDSILMQAKHLKSGDNLFVRNLDWQKVLSENMMVTHGMIFVLYSLLEKAMFLRRFFRIPIVKMFGMPIPF